jgi:hypothetical protein
MTRPLTPLLAELLGLLPPLAACGSDSTDTGSTTPTDCSSATGNTATVVCLANA